MEKRSKKYYLIVCLILLSIFDVYAQKKVKGLYITNAKDTVFCTMLKFNGFKGETATYKEIQIINNAGVIEILYPRDIEGYTKDGIIYTSMVLLGNNVFIKTLLQGKITLCYYEDGTSNGYYIFKRKDEQDFILMDYTSQFSKIIGSNAGMVKSSSSSGYDIKVNDKAFVNFFSEYFKDCEPVARKIKAEFYTKEDMIDIFRDYNNFFKLH